MDRIGLLGFELFLILLLTPMLVYRTVDSNTCSFGSPSFHGTATQQELKLAKLFTKSLPSRIQGPKQKIPYVFHQTNEADLMPADMILAIESVRQQSPEYTHRYYNATERRQFIKEYMGPTVLACYDKLIPNSYKADLFRYSVVLTHGGCYSDIGFVFIQPLRKAITYSDSFVSTADSPNFNANMNSAFFCAEPNHPILALTIKKSVVYISDSNYTDNLVGITGPNVFVKGFMEYFNNSVHVRPRAEQFPNGVRLLWQDIQGVCTSYPIIDSKGDGSTILIHTYPRFRADMSVLTNTPHYTTLYRDRKVFNESVIVPADGKYLGA